MQKIALITDSTCDLTKETLEKYNVRVLPFRIIYKDREYLDGVDITPEDVYNSLPIEIPTTSMPTPGEVGLIYKELGKEGYTHAIFITLSSGLSGIYNVVRMVAEENQQIPSFVYDSKSISLGEGILVEECGKMIQAGKSYEEIVDEIPKIRKRIHLNFVVGTLEYLKKGGRIGRVLGTISEILKIKPIISVGELDGRYYTLDKVRGRKQSLQRMIEITKEIADEGKYQLYIMSGAAREESEEVLAEIAKHPNIVSAVYGGDISPVSGVHSGPGLVGVLLFEV